MTLFVFNIPKKSEDNTKIFTNLSFLHKDVRKSTSEYWCFVHLVDTQIFVVAIKKNICWTDWSALIEENLTNIPCETYCIRSLNEFDLFLIDESKHIHSYFHSELNLPIRNNLNIKKYDFSARYDDDLADSLINTADNCIFYMDEFVESLE